MEWRHSARKGKLTGAACRALLDGFPTNVTARSKHIPLHVTLNPRNDYKPILPFITHTKGQNKTPAIDSFVSISVDRYICC